MKTMLEEFKETLVKTQREGMEDLVDTLVDMGLETAPCSGGHHLCKEGGLLEHSLNVLHAAEKIAAALYGGKTLTKELKTSIQVCCLLHDIGKLGQFDKPYYVENVLKDGGRSTAKPFKINPELLNVEHEIRSVVIATMYIDLTEEEQFAILAHNGLYGNLRYMVQGHETPLSMIVHWADLWATRVLEAGGPDGTEVDG